MAIAQHRLTEQDYETFVQSGIAGQWELYDTVLVEKPGMTIGNMDVISRLAYYLQRQLDIAQFSVYTDGRVQIPGATAFIPDLVVVPDHDRRALLEQPEALAILTRPLPLVVEVWSRSTGRYDVDANMPIYQQRGDAEIWLAHPVERTLTAWRRQPDGSYVSMSHRVGAVQPVALSGVSIELAAIFHEG